MLTRKQSELLRFINERLKETGVPPSFDEMKEALDLRSKSGIHRLILALEERGFIRRLPNRARALEVLRLPGIDDAGDAWARPQILARGDRGNLGKVRPVLPADEEDERISMVAIPVMGRIAAGTPITALQTRQPYDQPAARHAPRPASIMHWKCAAIR